MPTVRKFGNFNRRHGKRFKMPSCLRKWPKFGETVGMITLIYGHRAYKIEPDRRHDDPFSSSACLRSDARQQNTATFLDQCTELFFHVFREERCSAQLQKFRFHAQEPGDHLLCGFFGIYGYIAGWLLLLIHLAGLKSFGIPYLMPFAAADRDGISRWTDGIFCAPMRRLDHRPVYAKRENRRKMSLRHQETSELHEKE